MNNAEKKVIKNLRFNVELLTNNQKRCNKINQEQDIIQLQEIASFLKDKIIPDYIKTIESLQLVINDSESLTQSMHNYGINIRYLGYLYQITIAKNLSYLSNLILQEMIIRSAKDLLINFIKQVQPTKNIHQKDHWYIAPCIAKFLSNFLGKYAGGYYISSNELDQANLYLTKKIINKLANGQRIKTNLLHPINIWQAIRIICLDKYQYQLDVQVDFGNKYTMLRSLCKKVGIQINCRNYNFNLDESIFDISDILDLYPIIKELKLSSAIGDKYYNDGIILYQQKHKNHLLHAIRSFEAACNAYTTCFGPLDHKVAQCYSYLALIFYEIGQYKYAVEHQQRVLIIYQRINGLDSINTAKAHSRLALFLHTNRLYQVALKHLHRSLFLHQLIGNTITPSVAAIYANLSTIYIELSNFKQALSYAKKALQIMKQSLGLSNDLGGSLNDDIGTKNKKQNI